MGDNKIWMRENVLMYFWLFFLNRSFNRILLELWETQSALWQLREKWNNSISDKDVTSLKWKKGGWKIPELSISKNIVIIKLRFQVYYSHWRLKRCRFNSKRKINYSIGRSIFFRVILFNLVTSVKNKD